jgi:hypothetical protein
MHTWEWIYGSDNFEYRHKAVVIGELRIPAALLQGKHPVTH